MDFNLLENAMEDYKFAKVSAIHEVKFLHHLQPKRDNDLSAESEDDLPLFNYAYVSLSFSG